MPLRLPTLLAGIVLAVISGSVSIEPANPDRAPASSPSSSGHLPLPASPPAAAGTPLPVRAVPAYVTADRVRARTRSGSGGPDVGFPAARPAGAQPLWGDWFGQEVETLAYFRDGTWTFRRSNVSGKVVTTPKIVFGKRGDRPVAGDWNADGRTDLGVRRGSRWLLARGADLSGGGIVRVWRSFRSGGRGGQPVAGDWDGTGPDGVGVFRRGRWLLYDRLSAGARARTLDLGSAVGFRQGDVPVAGNWTGTGRDSVGIVRGSTWLLRTSLGQPGIRKVVVPRPPGASPAPWSTPSGRDGSACPTMSTAFRPAGWDVRAPAALSGTNSSAVALPEAADVRTALQRVERYLLGNHYESTWGDQRGRIYADVRGTNVREEYAVRLPAMSALTVAIALATGAHDDVMAERERTEALRYVDFLLRSLACQHVSVSPGGWGRVWQSDAWASLVGLAGWLLWDELSPQTRTYVTSMVADEAAYSRTLPDAYWRDRSGVAVPGREGNSAAEETAWSVPLLELAAQMDPTSPQAPAFRQLAVQRAAMAYSTAADTTSDVLVNGVSLRDRLDGYNVLDDGVVVNHKRVHPDYMAAIQVLWWAADIAVLGGGGVPEAYLHNGELVYSAFSTREFVAGAPSAAGGGRAYLPPGGTIYRPAEGDGGGIYFPDGNDWGPDHPAVFMGLDAYAITYDLASPEAWSPRQALAAHTRAQLALGDTSGTDDGRTYNVDPARAYAQNTYVGREEGAAQQVATTWLALMVGTLGRPVIDTSTYPVPR